MLRWFQNISKPLVTDDETTPSVDDISMGVSFLRWKSHRNCLTTSWNRWGDRWLCSRLLSKFIHHHHPPYTPPSYPVSYEECLCKYLPERRSMNFLDKKHKKSIKIKRKIFLAIENANWWISSVYKKYIGYILQFCILFCIQWIHLIIGIYNYRSTYIYLKL